MYASQFIAFVDLESQYFAFVDLEKAFNHVPCRNNFFVGNAET